MIRIRPYRHDEAQAGLLEVWQACCGKDWPMTLDWLRAVALEGTAQAEHVLAEADGQAVGFALARVNADQPQRGALLALGVRPDYRRQGVGRRLHDTALERLRARGARQVQLGAGAQKYFWPGVPVQPAEAWAFFQALGWPEVERSFDLTQSSGGLPDAGLGVGAGARDRRED